MKITYRVDDGYVGGDRPHYVRVDDSEIAECETTEEAERLIEEAVEDHFQNNVTPYFDFDKYRGDVARIIEKGKAS